MENGKKTYANPLTLIVENFPARREYMTESQMRVYTPLFPCVGEDGLNCVVTSTVQDDDDGIRGTIAVRSLSRMGLSKNGIRNAEDDYMQQTFEEDGAFFKGGETMLFPSEKVRDWGCYNAWWMCFDHERVSEMETLLKDRGCVDMDVLTGGGDIVYIDSVTHELKALSFDEGSDAITDYIISTGRRMTLPERKEHKDFKVGDVVVVNDISTDDPEDKLTYCLVEKESDIEPMNCHTWQIDACLSHPDQTIRLATDKEIEHWNLYKLADDGLWYDKDLRKVVFDFKPGDQVVVRNGDKQRWTTDTFSYYGDDEDEKFPYVCGIVRYAQCLPLNVCTRDVVGTANKIE